MPQVNGTISAIKRFEQQTKYGIKSKYSILIGAEWYSAFGKGEGLEEGVEVVMNFEEKGGFRNITDYMITQKTKLPIPQASVPQQTFASAKPVNEIDTIKTLFRELASKLAFIEDEVAQLKEQMRAIHDDQLKEQHMEMGR